MLTSLSFSWCNTIFRASFIFYSLCFSAQTYRSYFLFLNGSSIGIDGRVSRFHSISSLFFYSALGLALQRFSCLLLTAALSIGLRTQIYFFFSTTEVVFPATVLLLFFLFYILGLFILLLTLF